jgi:ribonuclease P protein component
MLAAIYRLHKQEDFEKIKKEGKLYQSENFGAQVLRKEKNDTSRFAFVVSTKISKHSIQRNRIKRAMREAVRHRLDSVGKGYDIVFLPKTGIIRKSTEEIMQEVQKLIVDKLER